MCFYFFAFVVSYKTLSNDIIKLHTSREKKLKKDSAQKRKRIHGFIYSIKIFIESLILSMNCATC